MLGLMFSSQAISPAERAAYIVLFYVSQFVFLGIATKETLEDVRQVMGREYARKAILRILGHGALSSKASAARVVPKLLTSLNRPQGEPQGSWSSDSSHCVSISVVEEEEPSKVPQHQLALESVTESDLDLELLHTFQGNLLRTWAAGEKFDRQAVEALRNLDKVLAPFVCDKCVPSKLVFETTNSAQIVDKQLLALVSSRTN